MGLHLYNQLLTQILLWHSLFSRYLSFSHIARKNMLEGASVFLNRIKSKILHGPWSPQWEWLLLIPDFSTLKPSLYLVTWTLSIFKVQFFLKKSHFFSILNFLVCIFQHFENTCSSKMDKLPSTVSAWGSLTGEGRSQDGAQCLS